MNWNSLVENSVVWKPKNAVESFHSKADPEKATFLKTNSTLLYIQISWSSYEQNNKIIK